MSSNNQAAFISLVSEEFNSWGTQRMNNQIKSISESTWMTFDGIEFIELLNKYMNE